MLRNQSQLTIQYVTNKVVTYNTICYEISNNIQYIKLRKKSQHIVCILGHLTQKLEVTEQNGFQIPILHQKIHGIKKASLL